jgi:TPR repeat protein
VDSSRPVFRLLLKLAVLVALPMAASAQDIEAAWRAAKSGDGAVALRELQPLAEQGSPAAQYALGAIYANGDGLNSDYKQAAHWFEQAARRGHVEARRHLVFMRQVGLVEGGPAGGSAGGGSFRIQVATVPAEPDGVREWRRLQRRHPDALGPLEMSVVAFETPEGSKLFRLQGGSLDEEGARAVCLRLREEGSTCLVIRP